MIAPEHLSIDINTVELEYAVADSRAMRPRCVFSMQHRRSFCVCRFDAFHCSDDTAYSGVNQYLIIVFELFDLIK